jgi:HAD superfamily hydrolase (TIGR01662 family)
MVNANNPLRFPYVLFDLGSTLIYFEGDWPTVMNAALQQSTQYLRSLGYVLDEQAFPEAYYALIQSYYTKRNDKFVEYTSEYVLEHALREHSYPRPPVEHLRQALKVMYAVTQAHWHVEQDAAPVLQALRARGHRLGIVSNASDDDDVQTLVDNAQLRPYFDFILTSAKVEVRKPGSRIFKEALAYWDAQPEQAVMIGDTVTADVAGANQLGIASVWILRRADTPENHAAARQHRPGATIYALSELPALLERWPEGKAASAKG